MLVECNYIVFTASVGVKDQGRQSIVEASPAGNEGRHMCDRHLLILYLRPARCKAREAATVEALSLLRDLDPVAPAGGPLSEQGGLFWLTLPACALPSARARFPHLGYTQAVDVAESAPEIQSWYDSRAGG